jgi:hypothetical protein
MHEHRHPDNGLTDLATLPSDAEARWEALVGTIKQMLSAADDAEGFRAAFSATSQAASGVDYQQVLNAVHLPKNADEHAEALREMLARIPDGWDAGFPAIAAGIRC